MKTIPKTSAPRGMWYNRFLDKQSEVFALVNALKPVAREIAEKGHQALDDSWNPDYHIELTLSVRECREIQKLVKQHEPVPAETQGQFITAEEMEMRVVKILAHELPNGDDKTADQLAELAMTRIKQLTAALKHCRSVLEPMAKQIICPKDNPLRRAVDAIDEAVKI